MLKTFAIFFSLEFRRPPCASESSRAPAALRANFPVVIVSPHPHCGHVKWLGHIFTLNLISGWLLVASPGILPLLTSLLPAACVADTVPADNDDQNDSSLAVDDSALPAAGRMQLVFRRICLRAEPVRAAAQLILVHAVATHPLSDPWQFRQRTAAAPRAPNACA